MGETEGPVTCAGEACGWGVTTDGTLGSPPDTEAGATRSLLHWAFRLQLLAAPGTPGSPYWPFPGFPVAQPSLSLRNGGSQVLHGQAGGPWRLPARVTE